MKFDILIKNGKIVDGTGSPWYRGDVGIIANKIRKIGNLKKHQGNKQLMPKRRLFVPALSILTPILI